MYKSIPFKFPNALRNRLKILLILLLLVELVVFIVVVKAIGIFATIGLVILSSMAGGKILRMHFASLRKQQEQTGLPPSSSMREALGNAMIMFAGILLIIPGFITDMIGLLLLVPLIRRFLTPWLVKKEVVANTSSKERTGEVIEGEYWRDDR